MENLQDTELKFLEHFPLSIISFPSLRGNKWAFEITMFCVHMCACVYVCVPSRVKYELVEEF
jgi:hypothetical protein